jgi:hypothetical protein
MLEKNSVNIVSKMKYFENYLAIVTVNCGGSNWIIHASPVSKSCGYLDDETTKAAHYEGIKRMVKSATRCDGDQGAQNGINDVHHLNCIRIRRVGFEYFNIF